MMKIIFYKRILNPCFVSSLDSFKQQSMGVKGIRPELCPAIRDFHSRGWFVGSPIELTFYNSREFDVDKRRNVQGKLFLSPGVIGDPDAKRLFARVDTGLSFKDLPVALMAIKRQSQDWIYGSLVIPPVIYPKGYTGPILLAVSSNDYITIPINEPLVHLIPMTDGIDIDIDLSDEYITHEKFEGLYSKSWEEEHKKEGMVKSTSLLALT